MKSSDDLKFYAHRAIVENWTAYDFSRQFNKDYQNTCKWYRDYKKLPISIALEMIDYLGCTLVIFRNK